MITTAHSVRSHIALLVSNWVLGAYGFPEDENEEEQQLFTLRGEIARVQKAGVAQPIMDEVYLARSVRHYVIQQVGQFAVTDLVIVERVLITNEQDQFVAIFTGKFH